MSTDQPTPQTRTGLVSRIQTAAQGTPYVTIPQVYGFDVTVDIANPVWQGLLSRQGIERVFVHRVSVDDQSTTITVSDALYELAWVAGVPKLGAQQRIQQDRTVEKSFHEAPGSSETHSFSSEEGRRLILDAARGLGWNVERGPEQKVGIVGAVIAIAIAALVLLSFAVLAIINGIGG